MIPTEGDQKFSVHIKQHVDEIQNRMFSLFDDLIEGKIRSFIISSNQSFVGKTFMTHSILKSKNIPYYTINVGSYSNNDFLLTDIIENNKKILIFDTTNIPFKKMDQMNLFLFLNQCKDNDEFIEKIGLYVKNPSKLNLDEYDASSLKVIFICFNTERDKIYQTLKLTLPTLIMEYTNQQMMYKISKYLSYFGWGDTEVSKDAATKIYNYLKLNYVYLFFGDRRVDIAIIPRIFILIETANQSDCSDNAIEDACRKFGLL